MVADDGFADGFCLCELCFERFEEVEGDDATLEFEGEAGAGLVLRCGADVVEEAGQEVCFWAEVPGGKMLFNNCLAWVGLARIRFFKGKWLADRNRRHACYG